MADSHDLIQTTTLTATSASISFTSIPQTYDTLKIVFHARATGGDRTEGINMAWNGATGLTSGRYLFWNLNGGGDLNQGQAQLELHAAWFPGQNVTANYFGSSEVYITNYSASTSKIYMCDNWHGTENTFSTNQAYLGMFSVITTGATSISNITFYPGTNFAIGTTISMYGIKGA